MHNINGAVKKRFTAFLYGLAIFLLAAQSLFAEGSKELNANGGSRAFLVSSNAANASFLFPTLGTMKVYVKAGETIYAGSSVQGNGFGTINLRAPNGNTYTSGGSTSVGLIANRNQELAGPLPNAGGYTPYTRLVQPGEEGIWEIDFVSQNNGTGGENPQPVAANANWTQPTGQYIAAFDISVRDVANASFLTGRVYTNIFSGILGTYDVGFNGVFKILTKDGYQYSLDNNGQAGNGFSFFVNNKGFRQGNGTASYQSINNLVNPNIQDPRAPDTESDITYKIFFNPPAADLPATAKTPGGGTTWLLDPQDVPSWSGPTFTGTEGTPNTAGTAPLGGVFSFTASKNGTYTVSIDIDHDGLYTSAVDVNLTGTVAAGANTVYWNGTDGQNNKAPAGNYASSVSVTLFGGEVHFPFFDVERNVNGIKLTRTNGYLAPDFNVYWNDSPLTVVGMQSDPIQTAGPVNSQVNGHKWGTPGGTGPVDFGDEKGIDTWSFIVATPLAATVSFQLQEADLEVSGITAIPVSGCVGQQVSYTIPIKNNGPGNITGSKFNIAFPPELTGITVNYTATSGASTITDNVLAASAYTATINMANGAVSSFTVTGKVSAMPAGGNLTITAGILRTADVTDPDATNPNAAPPADAQSECDANPSGPGCNNIKTNTTIFLAPPDAGPDQSIYQKDIATLKSKTDGVWAQIGNIPALAAITTPNDISTTITGLNDVGIYRFMRTNANGCTDTVVITVVPKTIDIPNVITPNGDGRNDTFTIPDIQLFPGSQLIIINRWGNEVYRSSNYQNTWDGSGLPEGTYYYVINKKEITGSITTFKGWVFLKR